MRANAGNGGLYFGFVVQAVSLSHDLTDMLEISGHGALQGAAIVKSGQRYASKGARSSIYGLTSRMPIGHTRLNRLIYRGFFARPRSFPYAYP
ncbi:hypothetical protein D3C72_2117390 [compost metagenome]